MAYQNQKAMAVQKELAEAAGKSIIDSYLIQRLEPPYERGTKGTLNPFTFGGGLRSGGLSEEAVDIVSRVFNFDYMGAAEFEFGAVPETLGKIAKYANDCKAALGVVTLNGKEVYYISNKEHEEYVKVLLKHLYNNPYEVGLKEWCGLKERLEGKLDKRDVCGWLELDNGFMFFTDKKMFEDTCTMFGVKENMIERLYGGLNALLDLKRSSQGE